MPEEARIPEKLSKNVKQQFAEYVLIPKAQAAIKLFSKKYPTIQFNRNSVSYWKDNSNSRSNDDYYRKAGRPNMLDDTLLVKVKDIALGACISGGVINRQQLINIGNGVIRIYNL